MGTAQPKEGNMATATYAPFEVVGWTPADPRYPVMLVLVDAGIPDCLVQFPLCLN